MELIPCHIHIHTHTQGSTAVLCQGAPRTPTHWGDAAAARGPWERGTHRQRKHSEDISPPPPTGGGHTSRRARAEGAEEAEGPPPPPSCSGAEQAHVPFGAHSRAAWPCRNGTLIAVSSTEALARAQLQEGTGSSPFTGESKAECALRKTAGPQTHAGLPRKYGVAVHTHTHTHTQAPPAGRPPLDPCRPSSLIWYPPPPTHTQLGGERLLCAPVGETTPQVAIPGPTSRRWGEVPHRRLGMAAWTHLANGEGICLPLRGLDAEK